jgi:DMSO reductase anchor subunit
MKNQIKELDLAEAVTHLLEECRMVLPGIQALFGFQLIAVFNSRFAEDLSPNEQILHLAAIGFVALAVAFVMTPASYHRLTGAKKVSEDFLKLATRMLLTSMCFLLIGICLDFYLISQLIIENRVISAILSSILFIVSMALWFVLPYLKNKTKY